MKKLLFLIVTLFAAVQVQAAESPFTLPAVKQWKEGKGVCVVGQGVTVRALQPELAYAADYLRQSLAISAPAGSDAPVVELVCSGRKKDAEAYTIVVRKDRITIKGDTPQAVLWGVQTLIQWSAQSPEIPCGTATDRPDYALRGMMIDVGRKYIPLDYLRHLVDVMSYYKMNCLQVHLNDNGFKKYFHQNWDETYAAFRIESELFPELTARDGYYSKRDFRNFILESARKGVEIIPEIDAPAHALAFTHFRPSLGCEEFGVDHFDLTNPAVVPFLDSLWTEYIGGPEPVFAGPRVHIGTDEYSNKKQDVVELFRSLTDHLIKFCQQHGKQPVVWGSLTYAKGDTPVQVDGVLMDMWSNGFANPKEMHDAGYQMVSIPDGYVYIVPAAGYYYDYLNCQYLYEHWTPANIGGTQFPEFDPQIEGGMFAVWNDVCGNGISVGDIHHRSVPAIQVIAEKCWRAVGSTLDYAGWDSQRRTIHCRDYEFGNVANFRLPELLPATSLGRDGEESQLGYDYQVDFTITWAEEAVGTVLTQSSRSKFYLSDPISGMLGYSRDGYLFTFRYSGRPGRTEHITVKGTNKATSLWVDGKLVETLGYNQIIAFDNKPYDQVRTLMFPLTTTGQFRSAITDFTAKKL